MHDTKSTAKWSWSFQIFDDQTYHFQTLRALNDIPYGGADTSEVLATIMTSRQEMPTAGTRPRNRRVTVLPNSDVAHKTRSAVAAPCFERFGMGLSLIGWLKSFRCTLEQSLALHGDWIMKSSGKSWTLSAIILAAAGTTVIGAGLYFIVLRPPLLPEDIRYMNLLASEPAVRGRLHALQAAIVKSDGER